MNGLIPRNRERAPWPRQVPLGWLIGVLTICGLSGCGRGMPIVDTAPGPVGGAGAISGTVRGHGGTTAVDGRIVEIINLDTGERQRLTTNNAGGFSVRLKPGKYLVELALRDGESFVRKPGIIDLTRPDPTRTDLTQTDLNRRDVNAHADFVLGTVRVSRPRGPAYRTDHGLGSPIA